MSFLKDYEVMVYSNEHEELQKLEDQIQFEKSELEEKMDMEWRLLSDEPDYYEYEMFKDTNDIDIFGTYDILIDVGLTVGNKTAGSF